MKKYLFFAAAAALLTACSSEELVSPVKQAQDQQALNFEVYTSRAITRAGAPGNDDGTKGYYGWKTADLQGAEGFGVFGYFTNDGDYDSDKSTPNFMYNEQVTWSGAAWTYEPVKYWPNEFGNGAESDETDKLTFFAYAPWIDAVVSTGVPAIEPISDYDAFAAALGYADLADFKTTEGYATDAEAQAALDAINKAAGAAEQEKNITQISKNTATGDPIVKYVVDTDPATSVDLLWGVAANNTSYTPISGTSKPEAGSCFIDLVKEDVADNGKISWNFKHALARLNVQIVAAVDVETNSGAYDPTDPTTWYDPSTSKQIGTEGDGTVDNKTNVWVRSIAISGFTMKGALNLHSDDVASVADAEPNWKNYDGVTELTYDDAVTFYDGLKDGKELNADGSVNVQKNEKPTGLNTIITAEDPATCLPTDAYVNLWETVGAADPDAPIYVIPTNEQMDITIVYDVETKDDNLAGALSDGSKGSSIENKIYKTAVFPAIEAGKAYQVRIIVGLTSVKFEAVVTDWDEDPSLNADVELPKN